MAVFGGGVCRCSLRATTYGSPPSPSPLQRIGPPSRYRGRPSQWSRCAAALRAQLVSRAERDAWAAAATPADRAAFLRCLECERLRSLHRFSIGNRSGWRFAFVVFAGFDSVERFPML